MSETRIIPVAKTIYLCDGTIGLPGHKTDLMGIFNSIRPKTYPHIQQRFVVFSQLINGLGKVPFYIDVRFAAMDLLVHTSYSHVLEFPHRHKVIQLAYTMKGCCFDQPGTYLVQLFCDGQWVADTAIELLQGNCMDSKNTNPQHQPETEWHGDLLEFSGPALAPDDPNLEPRTRKGRPANRPGTGPNQVDADDNKASDN